MSENQAESVALEISQLTIDSSLTKLEQIYDLIRRNEEQNCVINYLLKDENYRGLDVNEMLKNGDTILCLCCNKGLDKITRVLVEECNADINLCRNVNMNPNGLSPITPSITISARRQSRLLAGGSYSQIKGDSPMVVSIKYGFDAIAEYLVEKGADISNEMNGVLDFERSALQEAIRFGRIKIVEKMLQTMFERDDVRLIEWLFSKRYDILRQVLMTDNLETLKVVLPNITENRRIDGEMLIHIFNYLLMKSKSQERKEKVAIILDLVMETGSMDDGSGEPFEIINLDLFVRGFLATLKALFNNISSEDSRTSSLHYRTSLFFFILRYVRSLECFEEFYPDIDSAFDHFYTRMKETGENVLKLIEFFIQFYDTLITMGHIRLTCSNVANLLKLEHVKKLDILGDFLIQRSLIPLDLKELTRISIRNTMHTYNLYSINSLPVLSQECKDYLYFSSE
ncbi:hypothetical protein BpHYR1_020262 [Brachionus plicatilis]|uniref:Uncharacterized protein n=1 Tax=Brachionus plicatilis TaxID=10195 RepID=A0A3M7QKC7_BRAPC|nr:hypothetical protein BpHYR1_020262 [Brachionus plicatilis]